MLDKLADQARRGLLRRTAFVDDVRHRGEKFTPALLAEPGLTLLRATREGEALTLAAGLLLGGKRPIVLIQCTGFFEAGDALRNVVHDLGLPLFLVVGVRSWYAHRDGKTTDNCPAFTEPVVRAWGVPYSLLDDCSSADDLAALIRQCREEGRARIALLAE